MKVHRAVQPSAFVLALGSIVCFVPFVAAATSTDESAKKEVEGLMRRWYSLPPGTVEFSEFKGKFDARRGCQLQRAFLTERLIRQTKQQGCEFVGSTFARYPSLDSQAMSDVSDARKLIKYRLEGIALSGRTAVAAGSFPDIPGRVVYFLDREKEGWRVSNLLSFAEWPMDLRGEYSDCRHQSMNYRFALPVSAIAHYDELPAPCRALELGKARRETPAKKN